MSANGNMVAIRKHALYVSVIPQLGLECVTSHTLPSPH